MNKTKEDYTNKPVPLSLWGEDHWSTFAYIETSIVDHGGRVQLIRMRCNPRLHRRMSHDADGSKYPTRLNDGTVIAEHDDWSCAEDAVSLGLLEVEEENTPIGAARPRFLLTEQGQKIAAELRAHKGRGGTFATFVATV